MTHTDTRSLISLAPFLPKEPGLRAHVQRVAALATNAAEAAGCSRDEVELAYLAGLLHHYHDKDLDAAQAAKLWTAVGMEVPLGVRSLPPIASKALRALRHPAGSLAGWPALVDAANLFDEEMEGLPYEEVSVSHAMKELCTSGMVPQEFVAALASFRVVSPEQLRQELASLPATSDLANTRDFGQRWLSGEAGASFCKHAVEVAEAAAALFPETSESDRAEAYLAGMMHDVGLLAYRQPRAAQRLEEWKAWGFPTNYAEFLISGNDHAVLGAEFLQSRSFPESVVEAVQFHHRPELTGSRLAAALYSSEELDESLPSCAREHLCAKRLAMPATPQVRAAGQL